MSQELIETIARAMYERDCIGLTKWSLLPAHKRHPWEANARAAIAAIEASGTHCVAPMEANEFMLRAGDDADNRAYVSLEIYAAMLAARPKVTP